MQQKKDKTLFFIRCHGYSPKKRNKLNQKTSICVNTGVGTTEHVDAGEVLGSGNVRVALVSQINIDMVMG